MANHSVIMLPSGDIQSWFDLVLSIAVGVFSTKPVLWLWEAIMIWRDWELPHKRVKRKRVEKMAGPAVKMLAQQYWLEYQSREETMIEVRREELNHRAKSLSARGAYINERKRTVAEREISFSILRQSGKTKLE